ncbi:hypothetical protein NPS46_05260 [Pseudomonas putida]|uniref:hypothetical protein n=1 Tax=Pseudomonas putida TaxID=303 RepID=UPI00236381C1|nr:hypothetical protein [Pseudomonas putida]MDD2051960.1 hypothetical protein [Pseudomonas putida]
MKSILIFPTAFMANSFSLTLVMIGLSLFGKPELAADFGVVHGATVALFYAFSGNARSLILSGRSEGDILHLLRLRCFLLMPLYLLSVGLSVGLVTSSIWLVLLLVARRAVEWVAEIFLSEQEYSHRPRPAIYFFLSQAASSLLLLLCLCVEGELRYSYTALIIWAVSPFFWCVRYESFLEAFRLPSSGGLSLKLLLPHFGSTAVIGISVYVSRVFIILLAGRTVAGDFFSAFALGGVLGSVFAQALGPTFVHNESKGARAGNILRVIHCMVLGALCIGAIVVSFSLFWPDVFLWTEKSTLFWLAVGCSLIGSAVMVGAQNIRLRLLQNIRGQDAFGSDMLANIILVGCIPFIYYGLGAEALSGLYLLGSLLSYVFYSTENNGLISKISDTRYECWVLWLLVILIFLPIFFQLPSGIYRSAEGSYSAEGHLALLPMPLSVLVCYLGIVVLGRFSCARLSLTIIFFTFVIMLFTSLVMAGDYGFDARSKMMLILQYILPMFAFVLGQQFGVRNDATSVLTGSLFWVLITVVCLQLTSTIINGAGFQSSCLYFFSIYHSGSYVPVVFVGAFLIVLFSSSELPAYRWWVLFLSFAMGGYAALSSSSIALILYGVGLLCFLFRSMVLRYRHIFALGVLLSGCVGLVLAYMFLVGGDFSSINRVILSYSWFKEQLPIFFESDLDSRLGYWTFYLSSMIESASSFFGGHSHVLERRDFPSAYNYYLDFSYDFGVLAMLPLLLGIVYTFYVALRNWSKLFKSGGLFGLFGVVVFLLLVENFLQVGMRQPYSGIVVFFLWGFLLSKLIGFNVKKQNKLISL